MVHPVVADITAKIVARSAKSRAAYLAQLDTHAKQGPRRFGLGCANLAHGFAACPSDDKAALKGEPVPNVAIVSAYNDMLSAHQPFET